MQLDDTQAGLLKTWVVRKLEDISDADSDVLADYVLALVRGDDNPATVRQNCINELTDFLQESTEKFVDEVVKAVQTRSYDPSVPQAQPLQSLSSGPRKRTFDDRNDNDAPNGRYQSIGDRPMKQARRGGRGGRQNQQGASQWQSTDDMPAMTPQDAMNAMLAMHQAMGFPPLPGMPNFQQGQGRPRGRCRDYDNKGFCTRGASCKYEHGSDAMVVGGQNGHQDSGRGVRGRGGHSARGGRRAEFSMTGPSEDKSVTAIVIESIPQDKLDEQNIREFFSQFGTITQVDVQPQKRLAIVTYSTWEEANSAWKSPKVVFDNRFVKVFWYKPGAMQSTGGFGQGQSGTQDAEMQVEEPQIDHEEIAKRQDEAQRKHEENKKLREEAQRQKSDIDAKLKAMDEERKKMAELLAKKAAASTTSASATESEQTKGLKEQLAKLEAEAKILGIDPAPVQSDWQAGQPWRGRGGSRGRGRFSTRAAYRGSWAANGRGGAVKRLDNRPRTLAITFANGDYNKYDEAMQQYLLFSNNLEHATLSRHPDRADAAVLAFEERYRAENFMTAVKGPSGIPNIGSVEVSWMANPVTAGTNGSLVSDAGHDATMSNNDTSMYTTAEADYDVAEDWS